MLDLFIESARNRKEGLAMATVKHVGSAFVIVIAFVVIGIIVTYALGHVWFGPFNLKPDTFAEGVSVVGGLVGGGFLGLFTWLSLENKDNERVINKKDSGGA